jgi:hypothetical protein
VIKLNFNLLYLNLLFSINISIDCDICSNCVQHLALDFYISGLHAAHAALVGIHSENGWGRWIPIVATSDHSCPKRVFVLKKAGARRQPNTEARTVQ